MEDEFSPSIRKYNMRKKRKTTCLLQSSKYKFYLLTPSLHQIPYRMLVLCFFRFIATWLLHISYYIEKSSDYLVINICDYMQFNFLHSISTFCTVRDGDGQNTDPQSMDYPTTDGHKNRRFKPHEVNFHSIVVGLSCCPITSPSSDLHN